VNGKRILGVMRLAAIPTLVEEEGGEMDALHVIEHVVLLGVGSPAQVAHVLGIVVLPPHQLDVVHEILAVAHHGRQRGGIGPHT